MYRLGLSNLTVFTLVYETDRKWALNHCKNILEFAVTQQYNTATKNTAINGSQA